MLMIAIARHIVDDVDRAVDFYTRVLGFELKQKYGPAMAIVQRGTQQLWLAGPAASAAKEMPDGRKPAPGGWNRIVIAVDDLNATAAALAADPAASNCWSTTRPAIR
jgi:catechol 2,3-dioxygenase-like lactoylglutathione lyase family enzyme